MHTLYSVDLLLKAVRSRQESVAMWGAFQLLQLEDAVIRKHLPLLLSSPLKGIQEAGIAKVAEMGAQENLPRIIAIFREEEGRIKHSAALTLAEFPNDFSKVLLRKWYRQVTETRTTSLEFEAAVYSFLKIDPRRNFAGVLELLKRSHAEAIKSVLVLSDLFEFCLTDDEYNTVFDHYFLLRNLHTDADLTRRIVERFGSMELIDWLMQNVNKGFSVGSIFSQCRTLLGILPVRSEEECFSVFDAAFLTKKPVHSGSSNDHRRFIASLIDWVRNLQGSSPQSADVRQVRIVLDAFYRNADHLEHSIPRIIELETYFLLSLPLLLTLNCCVDGWLQNPDAFLERIADYYHSSLLLSEHRERILELFYPEQPAWTERQVSIRHETSPVDGQSTRKEVLWKFYQGELLGYDVSWPSFFPNPNYSNHLAKGLFLVYLHNFGYFIKRGDCIAIDYALQLFTLFPRTEVVDAICEHFGYLSLHHSELLYQVVEYLPTPRFLPLLVEQYRKEEYEIAGRIEFICDIFDLAVPNGIRDDLAQMKKNTRFGFGKRIRLTCDQCGNAYRYTVDTIFVDEETALKSDILPQNIVWTNRRMQCKNCRSLLRFRVDDSQLEEILLQSRVDYIMKTPPGVKSGQLHHKIALINFPRFQGRVFTPDAFADLVRQAERKPCREPELLYEMYIIQVRTYRSVQDWKSCLKVLKKIDPKPEFRIEWLFLMGFSYCKLSEFVQARVFFRSVVSETANCPSEESSNTFVEEAAYFCRVLDSKPSKKSRFRIVKGSQ